ncbi:efflux RND transporter permease subunit [Haloparvum sp. AD34]
MSDRDAAGTRLHEHAVDRVESLIVDRPRTVIVAFLLVTVLFGTGLGSVTTSAGTQQFAEDLPSNRALEDVQTEFSPTFGEDVGSTQLIQRSNNVLSRGSMLAMLRTQHRMEQREGMRVEGVNSAAAIVARTIDPSATTTEAQIRTLEDATDSEVRAAVRENADNPAFTGTVSNDFNRESASATAAIGVVRHEVPGGLGSGAGQGGSSPLTAIQLEAQRIATTSNGDITVFGSGIIAQEFSTVITDSLLVVVPFSVLFIVFFLVAAYRELFDLLLGTVTLLLSVVWTFGFLGLLGIPFSQIMITVPPLLLAVGIDFGIHSVNRYREERVEGYGIDEAMTRASDQLLVAFLVVTGTTVIGFLANLTSDLQPIREFGVVAAGGILFTFLLFGIFLPACKVVLDRNRHRISVPTGSQQPLGTGDSKLGAVLSGGVVIARKAPVIFLIVALLFTMGAGAYATGVDTSFSQEDFLPPEETPAYYEHLPDVIEPSEYTVVSQLNFLESKFTATQGGSATIYLERRMTDPTVLEEIHRAGDDPPSSFVRDGHRAESTSIVTVIQDRAERDPEFRRLVQRNDRNGNGIPDENLGEIYDYLLDSTSSERTLQYLAEDRRSARVVYTVSADASNEEVTEDSRAVADRFRGTAIATGEIVVFKAVSDVIFESAVLSLAVALAATVVFLVAVYWVLEGRPSLGVANTVPIAVAVGAIAGSMRLLGISFNAFTATILALTIGLGIDYSVHVVHRYVDERRDTDAYTALDRTVRGTGGALAGSMLTTASGIGVLMLAVLDVLGQFGLLTALSIVYSFVASLLVLPSVLIVWDRLTAGDLDATMGAEKGRGEAG